MAYFGFLHRGKLFSLWQSGFDKRNKYHYSLKKFEWIIHSIYAWSEEISLVEEWISHDSNSSRVKIHYLTSGTSSRSFAIHSKISEYRQIFYIESMVFFALGGYLRSLHVIHQDIYTCHNTLLKPKRHSLRCHDFMVHALLLRMCTNVVYFRVMRRLCRREWNWLWNWLCVNLHQWQRTRDHGVWRLTLTEY